jgi:hypothetical protein
MFRLMFPLFLRSATLFLLIFSGFEGPANAQPEPGPDGFSRTREFTPATGEMFVITHADRIWDPHEVSKTGIRAAIRKLRERMPVVLLSETPDPRMHFLYRQARFLHPSEAGEFGFTTAATHFYLAGGFLGACLDRTKLSLLRGWDEHAPEFTLTFVTDGIFGEKQFFRFFPKEKQDYYRELLKSMDAPLETLADYFRLLESDPDPALAKRTFVDHWLRDYEAGHSDLYEIQHNAKVEIRVNGEPALIREPAAPTDRILRIDFSPSDSL